MTGHWILFSYWNCLHLNVWKLSDATGSDGLLIIRYGCASFQTLSRLVVIAVELSELTPHRLAWGWVLFLRK